jgi:hypothetical protein
LCLRMTPSKRRINYSNIRTIKLFLESQSRSSMIIH